MSGGNYNSLTQRTRLVILILYIIGLFVTSKVALNTWLPPTVEKSIWFYSALAAILLGNLLVTPFFTKPADAISYSVASLVALLAGNPWSSKQLIGFDRFTWLIAITYVVLIFAAAIVSIVLRGSEQPLRQRISKSLFVLCSKFGSPGYIFTVVFLFALLTHHRSNVREYLTISVVWLVFVGLQPLEEMTKLYLRWRNIWTYNDKTLRLGEVVGHEFPNIVLVRKDEGREAAFGDIIAVRSDEGRPGYALVLDHVGFAEGCWLRAIQLSNSADRFPEDTSDGSVFLVPLSGIEDNPPHQIFESRDYLLGLVAPETTVGQMNIEVIRNDLALCQGSLVKVLVKSRPVLYQVVDGITREEIIHQKNTRGFVNAKAKKIGEWNPERNTFDTVPWLPQPNEPVLLVPFEDFSVNKDAVGHFPGTRYPVGVNLRELVIHNTAILGILGVGKSFLALELVERMISDGIKVICLDMTDQYAQALSKYYKSRTEKQSIDRLNKIGQAGKSNVNRNIEEGGSISEFTAEVKRQLENFLSSDSKKMLKIYNPVRFEVWRQDSRPFNDQASMATLTPCEITRIISEATLEVLQNMSMTDEARCCLVYEEAHSLIPEWTAIASEGDRAATNGTAKAILQGRKFGLGCLVITQRTANVTKTILNQCNTVFALRVFDATGMEFLRNYIGDDYAGVLSNLEDRHAVIFGRASTCRDPVLICLNDRQDFLKAFRCSPETDLEGEPF